MDWNGFNRELQNRVPDPGMRYILGLIYERVLDLSNQVDKCSEVTLGMAQALAAMVDMGESMSAQVRRLHQAVTGERDGVEVRSVPLTNEEREK
jgi:hypothetical protein